MSRRRRAVARVIPEDSKYHSVVLARFINRVMTRGKKTTAQRVVYEALGIIQEESHRDPMEIFEQAMKNATPLVEVKPRRIGGATYQVPTELRSNRSEALAMRWLVEYSRNRGEKSMPQRLAGELIDASQGKGAAVKKREDVHRMAEANRAFSHYRF